MDNKHTPAPWKWMYWQPDGQIVYNVKPVMRPIDGQIENKADAMLIAAAPDLLNALQMIFEEPQGCSLCDCGVPRNPKKGHQPDCPYELARLAVEKATVRK